MILKLLTYLLTYLTSVLWVKVNDKPFQLVTPHPRMTVVDGWRTVITADILLTADADTPPEQLRYDVITEPEVGQLKRRHQVVGPFRGPIRSFSQADINGGHVEFVHNVGNGSGSFVFQVSINQSINQSLNQSVNLYGAKAQSF